MIKGRYEIIQYLFNGDWKNASVLGGRTFVNVYEWAAICLFVLVTAIASISLQVIIEEVKNPLPSIANGAKTRLMKMGQNYSHISVFNQEINKCFGMFLLIFFLKQMITIQEKISVGSEQMLRSDRVGSFPSFVVSLLSDLIQCLILCYASHDMKNKVFGHHILINELLT